MLESRIIILRITKTSENWTERGCTIYATLWPLSPSSFDFMFQVWKLIYSGGVMIEHLL